jgi:diguanylate cyclase (GGDEF)-like protein
VIEGEEKLEKAIKASRAKARDQKQRLTWTGSAAASYLLDAVILGLYVLTGTVSASVLFVFVAGAAAVCGTMYVVYAKGWNLRFSAQNVIWPQPALAVALHLTVVALAPQLAFPWLSNFFTVFAFAFIWLSVRNSVLLWAASSVAAGVVLLLVHERAGIAASNAAEVGVTWLCFAAILGRCLLLSVYANEMRSRLAEGRRNLAASLEQIQELVHYDELTKAFNRRTLTQRLEQERSRAARTGVPFTVAMMDLDHFKSINDTHGHGVGDDVLRTYANTVHATMRDTDIFGRYGGEEFMLILTAITPESALPALERIQGGVAAADWAAIVPGLAVTQSIGVAGFRKDENVGQLLNRADAALYEAKRAGRNRIVVSE